MRIDDGPPFCEGEKRMCRSILGAAVRSGNALPGHMKRRGFWVRILYVWLLTGLNGGIVPDSHRDDSGERFGWFSESRW